MIDYLFALYPLYLSLEAVKKPLKKSMIPIVVFWITWVFMSILTSFIYFLAWWFPLIQLFDVFKIVLYIALYQPAISEQFRVIFLLQLWKNYKKVAINFLVLVRNITTKKFPTTDQYFLLIASYINKKEEIMNDVVENAVGDDKSL